MLLILIAVACISAEPCKWIGTAPFCKGDRSDCIHPWGNYEGESERGDGAKCWTGHKVKCCYSYCKWVGTAPFCRGHPSDCTGKYSLYRGRATAGQGNYCLSGYKVLCCEPRQPVEMEGYDTGLVLAYDNHDKIIKEN